MIKAQGRMISRSISDSEKFASLSPEAAVLFCMLIPHFNAHGKMNGGAGYVKDEVCPKISYLTYDNLYKYLKEISDKTNVKWFKNNGRYWIHSLNFKTEHQKLNPERLGEDIIPDYSESSQEEVKEQSPLKNKNKYKEKNKIETEDKSKSSQGEVEGKEEETAPKDTPKKPKKPKETPKKEPPPDKPKDEKPDKGELASLFIKRYCEDFKKLYGKNPIILGVDRGIALRMIEIKDQEKIMQNFWKSKDPFILKNYHSLRIIESQLNKLIVGGNVPTQKKCVFRGHEDKPCFMDCKGCSHAEKEKGKDEH